MQLSVTAPPAPALNCVQPATTVLLAQVDTITGVDQRSGSGAEGRARQAVPWPDVPNVLVVHHDEISRLGLAMAIAGGGDCSVQAMDVDDALGVRWEAVDTLLIDVVDPHRPGDQLPGIAVLGVARVPRERRPPRLVVLSRLRADDQVRRRVGEIGVDRYLNRSQVRSAAGLVDAVLAPWSSGPAVPPAADPEALVRLGITPRTRVNAGVAAAYAELLVPEAGWVGPRGRDRDARRARFNEAARLRPVDSHGLDQHQVLPSLRQIQRFVAWATRVRAVPAASFPNTNNEINTNKEQP